MSSLSYDASGNVTSRRLRDGNSIGFTYDALNRLTAKDLPGHAEPDVSYTYDLLGRMTGASRRPAHMPQLHLRRAGPQPRPRPGRCGTVDSTI